MLIFARAVADIRLVNKMKRIFLFFLFCIVLISCVCAQVDEGASWQTIVDVQCSGVTCVEGGKVGFDIILKNIGEEAFVVSEVGVVDKSAVFFANLLLVL